MMKVTAVRYISGAFLSIAGLVATVDSAGAQQVARGTVSGKVTSAEDGEPTLNRPGFRMHGGPDLGRAAPYHNDAVAEVTATRLVE